MSRLVLFFLFLYSSFTAADAVNTSGQVVLSVGQNVALQPDQPERLLKRKSEIFARDQISTGPEGRLQIRFTDNSRLSLSPDTEFRLAEYQFESDAVSEGRSVYHLIRGGLRTITGAISDANKQNYEVKTPIATIGVRGTHYSLFFCDQKCNQSSQAKAGLYGHVLEGGIYIISGTINTPVSSGQFFLLEGAGKVAEIQEKPFDLFEFLSEDEGALMEVETSSIPALDVNQQPLQGAPQGLPQQNQSRTDGTSELP